MRAVHQVIEGGPQVGGGGHDLVRGRQPAADQGNSGAPAPWAERASAGAGEGRPGAGLLGESGACLGDELFRLPNVPTPHDPTYCHAACAKRTPTMSWQGRGPWPGNAQWTMT
ncbi:hypothetical protein GCM10009535_47370 [Streptomyces thermocarboxydovorans]|uniref:Uncharacterized protein n=1 Tax=Streptomyces thermocarboxydovorans TaxID=59298 RepID=A0ABP3SVC5_9ACTN